MSKRPPTGRDLRRIRERLGLSIDAMADLLLATVEEVEEWERTGAEIPPDEGWTYVDGGANDE